MAASCERCGKPTVCQLENTETGEVSHVFDKCRRCLIETSFTFKPITEQITLKEDLEWIQSKAKEHYTAE